MYQRDSILYSKLKNIYEQKYGTLKPSSSAFYRDAKWSIDKNVIQISEDERIELIFYSRAHRIIIDYISESLLSLEMPKILQRKQDKQDRKLAEKKAKYDQLLSDI